MAEVSRNSVKISASDRYKKFRWLHECEPIVCFRDILLAIFLFSSHSANELPRMKNVATTLNSSSKSSNASVTQLRISTIINVPDSIIKGESQVIWIFATRKNG